MTETDRLLSEQNQDIFVEEKAPELHEQTPSKASIIKLIKYGGLKNSILLIFGLFGSLGVGVLMPLQMYVISKVIDTFVFPTDPASSSFDPTAFNQAILDNWMSSVNNICLQMVYFGLANGVCAFLMTGCLFLYSNFYGMKIRSMYLAALLRQDMAWYDEHQSGELTSKVSIDVQQIQDAVSNKLGYLVQTMSWTITALCLGFIYSWDVSLVILSFVPITFISSMFIGGSVGVLTKFSKEPTEAANTISEQCIGNIRTVHSLNQQNIFINKYIEFNNKNTKLFKIMGICIGSGVGMINLVTIASFSLGFVSFRFI
ncbi:multidrug resistance protein, putative [Entamoeba invadens IP1]|uniref:Multidrug resistance protein, putative n=1 Tax=Entamoeba invadens IP1 TaxID=370355 RepID=A0A0A1U427_ENTIV|nr:multidrug resistance protein, putative [Entamoeba invadens IP1]ELP88982.1 multidrug resistance protein, putative [Entamoeba invadens IP1]|eukprot:XP_004255753.1 multidrug resistance protein, putative [Entamoeba invadens IP1]